MKVIVIQQMTITTKRTTPSVLTKPMIEISFAEPSLSNDPLVGEKTISAIRAIDTQLFTHLVIAWSGRYT